MYGMVAANHGVAIVPRPLCGTPYNVKVLPIENEIPARKLYIQWNKEQYMPPPLNISGILLSAAA